MTDAKNDEPEADGKLKRTRYERELARLHVPRSSFYLLRPDGHVGLCGTRLDAAEVRRYVAERLRVRVPITQ